MKCENPNLTVYDSLSNFKVELNAGITPTRNNGTGKVTFPSPKVGEKFMKLVYGKKKAIRVNGHKVAFVKTKQVNHRLAKELDITPYLPPELEEEREHKLAQLDIAFHVDKVQFGVFYRDPKDPPQASRRFSTEYELSHRDRGAGRIWIEYSHKLIRIQVSGLIAVCNFTSHTVTYFQLGDPMLEHIAHNIAINFVNIRRFATGIDWGSPCMYAQECFQ